MKLAFVFAACALLTAAQASAQSIGDQISGTFYGNTSNPRDGTGPGVDPSLSPGPWACIKADDGSCTGDTTAGLSIGDFIGFSLFGAPKSEFANGKTDGPSFGNQ